MREDVELELGDRGERVVVLGPGRAAQKVVRAGLRRIYLKKYINVGNDVREPHLILKEKIEDESIKNQSQSLTVSQRYKGSG